MNKLDKFENSLKNSLGNYEVPYDASQWTRMEKTFNKPAGKGKNSGSWLAVASVAVVLIGASALIYNYSTSDENTSIVKNENITSGIIQPENNNSNSTLVPVDGNENKNENNSTVNNAGNNSFEIGYPENANGTGNGNEPKPLNQGTVNNTKPEPPIIVYNPGGIVEYATAIAENTIDLTKITPVILAGDQFCEGETVNFTSANTGKKLTGHWEIEGETEVTGAGFDYTFKYPGTYKVRLYFTHGNNDRKTSVTEKSIVITPSPEAAFTWNEVYTDGKPLTVFTNNSSRGNYNWRFKDGSVSNETEPKIFLRHKGNYPVELTVQGENGCTQTVSQTVVVENEYNLLAPNMFTPNGDALNNTFIPEALKVIDVDFTLTIYDRSGKLVYSTKTANKPWDGRYTSDNKVAPNGAYVWIVVIPGEEPYKGSVTIVE